VNDREPTATRRLLVGDRVIPRERHHEHCTSTSWRDPDWWLCDRATGHDGPHACVSLSGLVLATWADGDFDTLLTDADPRI
jgi:hypothetical protein